jgi:hypothetical protein
MAKSTRTPTRGSSTPTRGGGRPAGRPGVYVATPQSDIYVTLLGVALGSMLLSILLLTLRLSQYEFKITP